MALQEFIHKNSALLVQLSQLNVNSLDHAVAQKGLNDVFSIIKKLRTYFTSVSTKVKPPEFNDEKEEIMRKVQEAYKCYEEVIKWWKLQDGEKALHHGIRAVAHLIEARKIGYQHRGCDFFIFIVPCLIAFKLGILRITGGLIDELKRVAEYNDLHNKFVNVKSFCGRMCKYFDGIAEHVRVEVWLGNMITYWMFLTLEQGELDDKKELEDSKNLYAKYSKTDLKTDFRMENLRKSTLSRIVRSEFVCLIHFFTVFLIKDTGEFIVRVKRNKIREVRDKLTKLNEYLEELNVIEENASSYTFVILLISSISYHLLEDYHAAVRCFERTKSAFEKLGDDNHFKGMFEMINFQKFESVCMEKSSRMSDPKDTIPLTPIELEEESFCKSKLSRKQLSRKHTVPLFGPADPTVSERLNNEEVAADDDAVHDEIALEPSIIKEEHEDDEIVVEPRFEERASIEEKYEAHLNVEKVFDWVYEGEFAYNLMNDYNFANVKRSLDNEAGYEEKGTLIRYRNFSVAKKEFHAMQVIEKSCPTSSQFIMRAKSSIYKQMVREGGEDIPVYDFVVERGIPFACWLEDQKKIFNDRQVEDPLRKEEWWKFIRKDVKRLFRGVVRGLWMFSSLDMSFLGFHKGVGMFLCDTHGISYMKMKPCLLGDGFKFQATRRVRGKRVTGRVRDIRGLRKILSWVIEYPFKSTDDFDDFDLQDNIVKDYSLDLEMRLCLNTMGEKILKNMKLTSVKFDHLIDSPFFWTKEERIGFLFKWTELAQRSLIPSRIDSYILFNGYGIWCKRIGELKESFGEESPEKMEDRVLHAIYSKVDNKYKNSKDVVKFGVNTIKHYNSHDYRSIRPKILTNVQIEAILRAHIPGLYFALVQAIFTCTRQRLQWDHKDVCLKELLSRRFPKGECDEGCSPYVICDHLLK